MKPHDLIETARMLAETGHGAPKQSHLARAVSTTYFSLFHTVALCVADNLVGSTKSQRSKHAWRQAYRSVEHGRIDKACKRLRQLDFPKPIQDFGNVFRELLEERKTADYDPAARFVKSSVWQNIDRAESAINRLKQVKKPDLCAFAALIMFNDRFISSKAPGI